jgi:hypothetical protein
MRRKTLLLTLGLLVLIFGIAFAIFYGMLKHKPGFYQSATMAPSEDRTALSREFESRYANLINSIYNRYPDWWEVFTTEHINAFLQEGFLQSYGGNANLPPGFSDLRVQVEEGRLRIGCRYGTGFFSTVLSIEVRMWLVANEVNLIGVELLSLRAGALPISKQMILSYITETASRSNIDCNWYRHNGNPVAILKLQADQLRPTIQLQRFELQPGKIIIVGRSLDLNNGTAAPKSDKKP